MESFEFIQFLINSPKLRIFNIKSRQIQKQCALYSKSRFTFTCCSAQVSAKKAFKTVFANLAFSDAVF